MSTTEHPANQIASRWQYKDRPAKYGVFPYLANHLPYCLMGTTNPESLFHCHNVPIYLSADAVLVPVESRLRFGGAKGREFQDIFRVRCGHLEMLLRNKNAGLSLNPHSENELGIKQCDEGARRVRGKANSRLNQRDRCDPVISGGGGGERQT